jgi:hypothetical protein
MDFVGRRLIPNVLLGHNQKHIPCRFHFKRRLLYSMRVEGNFMGGGRLREFVAAMSLYLVPAASIAIGP